MPNYEFKDFLWEANIQDHKIRGCISMSLPPTGEKTHSVLEERVSNTVAKQLIQNGIYKSGPDGNGNYQAVLPGDIKLIDVMATHTFPIVDPRKQKEEESDYDRKVRRRRERLERKVKQHEEKLVARRQKETKPVVGLPTPPETLPKKKQANPNRISKEDAQKMVFEHFTTDTRRMTEAAKALNLPYARIRVILFKMAEEGYNRKTLRLDKAEVNGNVAFKLVVTNEGTAQR